MVGRRCGRPKITWRKEVVKQVEEIGLKKEDAIDRSKWRKAVNKLSQVMGQIRPSLLTETKPDLKHWRSLKNVSLQMCPYLQ